MGTVILTIPSVYVNQHSGFKLLRHSRHVNGYIIPMLVLIVGLHDNNALFGIKSQDLSCNVIIGQGRPCQYGLAEQNQNAEAQKGLAAVLHGIPLTPLHRYRSSL
ncbi:MAG TPA: hypothetical protein VIS94_03130 [Desulfomonilia bacterium]